MINASYIDETTLRVRYAETDAMGVVHHSQYVIWFEVGRSSFLRNANVSYAEVEQAGHQFRIAEIGVRYRAPACYDQVVTVRTWLSELHSRGLTFSYAIVRPEAAGRAEQVLVTGFTKLICTDRAGQVHRLPAELRQALQSLAQPLLGRSPRLSSEPASQGDRACLTPSSNRDLPHSAVSLYPSQQKLP